MFSFFDCFKSSPAFSRLIEKKINYNFRNKQLLQIAITHKSINPKPNYNYERFELVGDSVINLIVTEWLSKKYPNDNEGDLTTKRASLVNTQSLSGNFQQLDCKDLLQTSKGTKKLDETHKHSIYAGTLEACIGAIFIELGFEESKVFILQLFQKNFSYLNESSELKDAKSRLQEALQARGAEPPQYSVVSNKEGNNFDCSVTFNGKTFRASDVIKKESEQKVAALILLELDG